MIANRAKLANMGRGKDKVILGSDLPNMSRAELASIGNKARMGQLKVSGTAVVRDKNGNAKYDDPKRAGNYNEDKL